MEIMTSSIVLLFTKVVYFVNYNLVHKYIDGYLLLWHIGTLTSIILELLILNWPSSCLELPLITIQPCLF